VPTADPAMHSATTLRAIVHQMRRHVVAAGMDVRRLPPWVTQGGPRWCLLGPDQTLLAVFGDRETGSAFDYCGRRAADIAFLLSKPDFQPEAASLDARNAPGAILIRGSIEKGSRTTVRLEGAKPAFMNCGYSGPHGPLLLADLAIGLNPTGPKGSDPAALAVIPFAMYLHQRQLDEHPVKTWERMQALRDMLRETHDGPAGDLYETRIMRQQVFAVTKETSVLVLGAYAGAAGERLLSVRQMLRDLGWDANLLSELNEIPMMSNEEKLRLWAGASRFCVMVDEVPSGHLAEYMMLREQRVTTAVLRPSHGSSWMVGDDAADDVNFIRNFDASGDVAAVLQTASDWARDFTRERARRYNALYPWRT
jgi:hypothetical protein